MVVLGWGLGVEGWRGVEFGVVLQGQWQDIQRVYIHRIWSKRLNWSFTVLCLCFVFVFFFSKKWSLCPLRYYLCLSISSGVQSIGD